MKTYITHINLKKTRASEAIRRGLKLAWLNSIKTKKKEIEKAILEAMDKCQELVDENMCLSGIKILLPQDVSDNPKVELAKEIHL